MVKRILISLYYRLKLERVEPIKNLYLFYNFYLDQKINSIQDEFRVTLEMFKSKHAHKNGILLTQMVEDYESTIKLAAASKVISDEKNLTVYGYDVHIFKSIGWANKYQDRFDKFFKTAKEKIHLGFAEGIIFKNDDKFYDQKLIKSKLKEISIGTKTREDLLRVEVEGILIGDLIYDTYLRFYHQPTVAKIDENVLLIVEVALNIFYNFQLFLKKNNVQCIVNTYAGYIQHAVPVRLAEKEGIEIFTMGSRSYLIQKFDSNFPYCSINHTKFRPDNKLPNGALEVAEKILTFRLKGNIDPATYYMKESSFTEKPFVEELTEKFTERKRNVVVYAHEFYDAPHINRKLEFVDLYQYLREILQNLSDVEDTSVFIKTHPGGMKGTKEEAIKLVNSFNKSHFHVLDEAVSNLQIVNLKPDVIATARGSVGVEMAFFELPVVALYDNTYINFDFVHTCYDKESYFAILRGEERVKVIQKKEDIFSYYYQVFLDRKVIEEPNVYSFLTSFSGDTYNDDYLTYLLDNNFEEKRNELLTHYKEALVRIRKEDVNTTLVTSLANQ